jgi:hypothetical protein
LWGAKSQAISSKKKEAAKDRTGLIFAHLVSAIGVDDPMCYHAVIFYSQEE